MAGDRKKRKRVEDAIQKAVVDALRLGAPDGLLWQHVPNGGRMDPRRGWYLNRMGQRPGASDLLLVYQGRTLCLELKSKDGRQSKEQREYEADAIKAGASYAIARSSAEALEIIRDWGCEINARVAA